ncbi:O-acyltransferase like protein-like [Mytilus edulis]|uniref:O-acyltransferase like protein-like n=1 Tax=Mytilus edulis TaxID=6550 RepID=UPI0039F12F3C
MAYVNACLLCMFLCLTVNVLFTSAAVHGSSEVKDEEKPYYIADVLVKNPNLTRQLWKIGEAAAALASSGGGTSTGTSMDQQTKNSMYNYILDNIPVLMRNEVFQNITHDITDEISKAYSKSDFSKNVTAFKNENGSFTNKAAMDVLKHLDVVRLLQRSIQSGKPVIDEVRGNDSTVFIAVVNYLIGMAPVVWKDPSFIKIKGIVTQELTLGYNTFLKEKNVDGPALAEQNSTLLVMGVLQYTKKERMLLRSMQAAKPVIDKLRGKDSTALLMGLGFLAQEYPVVMADPRYQHIQAVVTKYVEESFGNLNYTLKDLQKNQNEVVTNVIANISKIHMIQDILRGGSIRDVLPLSSEDTVNDVCYGDAMDFVDSMVEISPWALKMFDSMGKLREGVMHGQLNLVGSFDECMEIQAQIKAGGKLGNRTKETASSFGTRYCRVSMDIPSGVLPIDTKGVPVHLTWGACVPDSCHSRDISGLFKLEALRNMTTTFDGVYVYCFDNKPITEDDSAVAAIVMLSIFGLLIVVGTLYMMVTNMKHNAKSTGNAYELPKVPLEMKAMYNMAYQNDEAETKVDLSNRTTDIDIPKAYMPHAESNQNGLTHTNGSAGNGSVGNGNASYEKQSFHQLEQPSQQSGGRPKANSEKKKQGVLHRILKAFALQENVEKILSGKTSGNSINCIHGIRFLSLTWVILGHTFNYGIVSIPSLWTTENIVEATEMMKRFTFQAVIAGGFSVDTFYMISGMLLTYLQIKQVEKLTKRFNCAKTAAYTFNYYFHRIWRLTPMYMMVIMVYGCLMKYFGDGPLWPEAVKTADDCKINWWTNLLYVNNLVHVDGQCMAWSWYLANDMQFYVVSLFFLVFLAISIPVGVILICLLMTGGVAAAWYEEHIYNGSFFTTKKDGGGYWNNVYISPWCRVAAYCVGMLLGVLLYKRPKKALKTKYALLGWSLATAMGLGLVYCTYSEYKEGGTEWSRDFRAAYESLGRPLWAACVAWVVFACHNGNGGVVNSLLSWKGLIPLSRLSYAAYLVHPIMMMIHVYSKRALVYISDYEIIYLFLGHTCFTFMVAFVVSISFEAPFMALEKIIMGR